MNRTALSCLLVSCLLTFAATAEDSVVVRNGSGEEILLQGFHWNASRNTEKWYSVLSRAAPTIGKDGFTMIWMPPPWADDSEWRSATAQGGGEGYFWHSFDKNSRYGSDEQLKQASAALTQAGVKVVFDVVPNHMSDQRVDSMFPQGRNEWRRDCSQCDEGEPFMDGSADLNTGNAQVFETFKNEYINLRDQYGAQGLRFDFVKGYAAETVDRWMNAFGNEQFCVGEFWQAPGEFPSGDWRRNASWQDALKDWSDRSHCTVFDFALKERFQNGSIADWRHGLNGNPDPAWRRSAVTFVDNHDTGYSPGANAGQHHWPLVEARRNQAYAYILASPGTPTVYWPDMYDWQRGDLIRKLIALRKTAGIRADSAIRFHTQYSGLVASVAGTRTTLVIALDSDLQRLPQGQPTPTLEWDNGAIRIWATAAEPATVKVRFNCDNARPQPGESIFAVGSSLELGVWDPRHAIALTANGERWSTVVEMPDSQLIQWKCIARGQSPDAVRWQADPDVSFSSGPSVETNGRL
ncbi:DUF1921 domain-containing protein [Pseudomonas syringae]|nr:DUF1921 domain-containing protein [Pseudomonas syringae]MCF5069682.1 DUF1921 domain-containing protein [Pseudomonas syringae]